MGQTFSGDERVQFSAGHEGVENNFQQYGRNAGLLHGRRQCTEIGMLCYSEFVFEIGKYRPFRQAITKSSICNKVFWTMFLKSDSEGIIPRRGYRVGIANLLRLLYG